MTKPLILLAMGFSFVGFCVFIKLLLTQAKSTSQSTVEVAARSITSQATSADELAKVMEALGKLVETLKTASPALLALTSSILFLLIAVLENLPLIGTAS